MSQGVYVLGGKCPGGKCPGGKCPGGKCLGGKCPGGTCPRTRFNALSLINANVNMIVKDCVSNSQYSLSDNSILKISCPRNDLTFFCSSLTCSA